VLPPIRIDPTFKKRLNKKPSDMQGPFSAASTDWRRTRVTRDCGVIAFTVGEVSGRTAS
jgi:hypothetical protein